MRPVVICSRSHAFSTASKSLDSQRHSHLALILSCSRQAALPFTMLRLSFPGRIKSSIEKKKKGIMDSIEVQAVSWGGAERGEGSAEGLESKV